MGLTPGKVDETVLARCNTMEAFREQPDGAGLGGKVVGKVCGDKDGRKAFASRDGQVMVTWATSARKFGRQRYATTYEFNCALESVLSNPCLIPCPLLPLPVLVDFDYYRYLYKRLCHAEKGQRRAVCLAGCTQGRSYLRDCCTTWPSEASRVPADEHQLL